MKPYNGYAAEAPKTSLSPLPAGGYVAKIIKTEIASNDYGDRLIVYFDITEGEHKGHFNENYAAQTSEDKKWKGAYRLSVPKDDGSEKDEWSKRSFNNFMWAVEDSNPGYHWDWNEAGLKGKTVGVLFRNKEWEMNGNTGWTTECCATTSADNIRNGKFKMPKDKPLANKSASSVGYESAPIPDDDDCPF